MAWAATRRWRGGQGKDASGRGGEKGGKEEEGRSEEREGNRISSLVKKKNPGKAWVGTLDGKVGRF